MTAELIRAAAKGSKPPRRASLGESEFVWAAEIIRDANEIRRGRRISMPQIGEAIGYSINTIEPVLSGRKIPGRGLVLALEDWVASYNGAPPGGDDGADKFSAIALEESVSLVDLLEAPDDD